MNQGKLEVVKEETARVNILGTSKLKWREYVNLIQMTIISTTVGKNPLGEIESPHSQQKSLKCSIWVQSQKRHSDLCLFPRQAIQYHSSPSLFSFQSQRKAMPKNVQTTTQLCSSHMLPK